MIAGIGGFLAGVEALCIIRFENDLFQIPATPKWAVYIFRFLLAILFIGILMKFGDF